MITDPDETIELEQGLARLSSELQDGLGNGHLSFPTVFDLSLRIRQLVDDPGTTLEQVATLVRSEPVLMSRLLKMANSPLLNPSARKIDNVATAISRIGLTAFRCLAFAVTSDQIARDARSEELRTLAHSLWVHSIDLASWSYALSRHTPGLSSETAMLAGLVTQMGRFYLIACAAQHPVVATDRERFAQFVVLWDSSLRGAILQAFKMPIAVIQACSADVEGQINWPPQTLSDVLLLARLTADTTDPIGDLLGWPPIQQRFADALSEEDHLAHDELVAVAAETREQMLSALSG